MLLEKLELDNHKAIRRIAQPQSIRLRFQNTFCVRRGLGRSLNKLEKPSKPQIAGWTVFRICTTNALLAPFSFEIILTKNTI